MSREAVIAAYGRSAVCRARKGSFAKANMHPIDYSAQVVNGILDKIPQLDRSEIEDIIMGCAVQHNRTSMIIAKGVAVRAGLPECVGGITVNRFCSGGLQAIATANNAVIANQGDVFLAGGVEDMTGTLEPYPDEYKDKWLVENFPGHYMPNGITAENIVKNYGVTREQMDQLAVESHRKAAKAQAEGKLDPSIIPVMLTDEYSNLVLDENGNPVVITKDEGIRPGTSMESLAGLKPCFIPAEEGGTVTAATSSQMSDAAAFAVVMEKEKAEALGIKPIARLVSFATCGCDSTMMGLGPIYAVPKALKRAGLTIDDMDVIELNEAFAAQVLPCIEKLGMNPEKVNPYGGAMALGHPMGATGAFLLGKALDYLQDNGGKYAMVTMCIGSGMGAAGIFELL